MNGARLSLLRESRSSCYIQSDCCCKPRSGGYVTSLHAQQQGWPGRLQPALSDHAADWQENISGPVSCSLSCSITPSLFRTEQELSAFFAIYQLPLFVFRLAFFFLVCSTTVLKSITDCEGPHNTPHVLAHPAVKDRWEIACVFDALELFIWPVVWTWATGVLCPEIPRV